jgi:hypothetical protein
MPIKIQGTVDLVLLVAELLKKYGTFLNLTISRTGTARLQIFTNPSIHYSAANLDDLVMEVWENEGL